MNENQNNDALKQNDAVSDGATEAATEKPTKKKSKKKALLIILPIVIVAILAVAALIIYQEVTTHFCAAPRCNNWEMAKGYSYCAEHTCNCAGCKAPKADDSNYCEEHTCAYSDCTELALKDAEACEKHLCKSRGCMSAAYREGFCAHHLNEKRKEEAQAKEEEEQAKKAEIEKFLKRYNVNATYKDAKYSPYDYLGTNFSITGTAELDDYFNYDYRGLESIYFCICVTPNGGSYSDQWYIYADRRSNSELLNLLKNNSKVSNVTFVAQSFYPDALSHSMATLVDYRK